MHIPPEHKGRRFRKGLFVLYPSRHPPAHVFCSWPAVVTGRPKRALESIFISPGVKMRFRQAANEAIHDFVQCCSCSWRKLREAAGSAYAQQQLFSPLWGNSEAGTQAFSVKTPTHVLSKRVAILPMDINYVVVSITPTATYCTRLCPGELHHNVSFWRFFSESKTQERMC